MTEPEAWIVSGIPGSGKTTVARLLAATWSQGVHIEGDLVGHQFIVTGLVAPHQEPKQEAMRQLAIRRQNIVQLANTFLESGFTVAIDDVVVSASVLETYMRALPPPIRFVQLSPSLEVVEARDAGRHKQVFGIWQHLHSELQRMPRRGLWLDTSELSAEDTVEAIRRRAEEARVKREL